MLVANKLVFYCLPIMTRKWTPTGSGKGKEGERKEGKGCKLVMFDVKAWMHEFEYE